MGRSVHVLQATLPEKHMIDDRAHAHCGRAVNNYFVCVRLCVGVSGLRVHEIIALSVIKGYIAFWTSLFVTLVTPDTLAYGKRNGSKIRRPITLRYGRITLRYLRITLRYDNNLITLRSDNNLTF